MPPENLPAQNDVLLRAAEARMRGEALLDEIRAGVIPDWVHDFLAIQSGETLIGLTGEAYDKEYTRIGQKGLSIGNTYGWFFTSNLSEAVTAGKAKQAQQ